MMARDQGINVSFQMPLYPMLSNFEPDSSRSNHGRLRELFRSIESLDAGLFLKKEAKKALSFSFQVILLFE